MHIEIRNDKAFKVNDEGVKTEIESLVPYLGYEIDLIAGTKFGEFLSFVFKDISIMEKVFRAALAGHPLMPFYKDYSYNPTEDEIAADREDETPESRIDYLELSWQGQIYDNGDKKELQLFMDFGGVGPQKAGDGASFIGGWAIEFTPLYFLKDYELKLKTDFVLEKTKRKSIGYAPDSDTVHHSFTVYNVIYGILDEISFCGTPTERAARASELDQRKCEIEDHFKEKDGVADDQD